MVTTLAEHRRGQVVWSHASVWTGEPPFAADVITFVYQYNRSAWGEQIAPAGPAAPGGRLPPRTEPSGPPVGGGGGGAIRR